jgi:hypothetical protein
MQAMKKEFNEDTEILKKIGTWQMKDSISEKKNSVESHRLNQVKD